MSFQPVLFVFQATFVNGPSMARIATAVATFIFVSFSSRLFLFLMLGPTLLFSASQTCTSPQKNYVLATDT